MATAEAPSAQRTPVQTSGPEYRRVGGYVAVVVGMLALFYGLYQIRTILFLLLVAVLLATAIEPLVLWIRRGPFSRGQGILIVYSGIMAVILAIGIATVPIVLREATAVVDAYPRILQQVREIGYGIDEQLLGPATDRAVVKAADSAAVDDDGTTAITIGLTMIEGVFAFVTVFVVAYYWLTERIAIKRALTTLFPRDRRVRVGTVWNDVERVLGAWVRGQLFLMVFVGVLAGAGYALLGVKYALVLGILAGLFEIVPLVGPWLGAIPAILVALSQDVTLAVLVGAYLLVLQSLEGYVLVPRVMKRAVGVSSLVVILGLLVGAALGGIAGALVAVPVAAAIQVILRHALLADSESPREDVIARADVVESTMADLSELPLRRSA